MNCNAPDKLIGCSWQIARLLLADDFKYNNVVVRLKLKWLQRDGTWNLTIQLEMVDATA